jgi:tetratricopeptide (TPR) repeat protein
MRERSLVSLAIAFGICAACSPSSSGPPAAGAALVRGGAELRAVPLPDVSKAVPSVQRQIQERHASLTKLIDDRSTVVLELSNAFGEMGKLLMAAQMYEAAEPCFLDAQTLNTADFRWPYYLAQLYRAQGELPKALAHFERAIALQPDDVSTLVWLGEIYLQQGRPEAAEPQFSKALALQPGSVSARYGLGRTALARNDAGRAVTYLEEVLQRDPKASGAHYPLSLAYAALGNTQKADEHLRLRANREILPSDPLMVELENLLESPQTYETLGIRALEREDWSTAADQFRKGLVLAPDSAALHHRLGAALSMTGDKAGARQQFETAVQLSPDYFLAQYSLGVLDQADDKHAQAVERFAEALRARPIYTEARLRMASSLRRIGRHNDALRAYQQVLSNQADSTEAVLGYSMTLAQIGRHREARDRLAAAAQAGDADAIVFRSALARLLAASPDDAVRDGAQAMRLVQELIAQGRTLELGETMAMALAAMGEYDRAAAVQRDLLKGARTNNITAVMPRLAANLARYERGEPCRTPWTLDEMP